MIKLFFYNKEDRTSQIAYKALMKNGVDITPFEITGRNVANRLKQIGVTKIPTLYIRDQRNMKMLVGDEILEFLNTSSDEREEESYSDDRYERARQKHNPPSHLLQKPKHLRQKEDDSYPPSREEEESEVVEDEGGSSEVVSDVQIDASNPKIPDQKEEKKLSASAIMEMANSDMYGH